jgi:hypothetical protein
MENDAIHTQDQFTAAEPGRTQSPSAGRKLGRSLKSILDGTFLTRERFFKALPFLLYLVALALAYIANVYYLEKTIRQMDDTERELQELRFEYITTKSGLMNQSKSSVVAKRLEKEGIRPSTTPPEKIRLEKGKIQGGQ